MNNQGNLFPLVTRGSGDETKTAEGIICSDESHPGVSTVKSNSAFPDSSKTSSKRCNTCGASASSMAKVIQDHSFRVEIAISRHDEHMFPARTVGIL